jgi:signal peptidase I
LVSLGSYDVRFPFTDRVLLHRGDPELGDLVLIESPDNGRPIFKRIAALPGDRVVMENRHLTINGHPLQYTATDNKAWATAPPENMLGSVMEREALGRIEHLITYTPGPAENSSFAEVLVPPDHYFMLGDNRDQSRDSRAWGPVSRSNVRGRVIAMPTRR